MGGMKTHTTIRNWTSKHFPKLFQEIGDKELFLEGKGKEDEIPGDLIRREKAIEHIYGAMRQFQMLEDEYARGAVISTMEDILKNMKTNWQWEDEPFDF